MLMRNQRSKRYLITGGAGFIGSRILKHLYKNGSEIRILDNFSSGQWHNLRPYRDGIEIIDGDIRDYNTVKDAVLDTDIVIHQAAIASVAASISDPLLTNSVNTGGTLNVLAASKKSKVQRVVFASTASFYC